MMMGDKVFGAAGDELVVEEFLERRGSQLFCHR